MDSENDILNFFGKGKKNDGDRQKFICMNCAEKNHKKHNHNNWATWHVGKCEECEKTSYITQLRDFY